MAQRSRTILAATGFTVAREYYINDAGRQMEILGVSTWMRYLELCGEIVPFPSNGYRGDYVRPLAQALKAREGERTARSGRQPRSCGVAGGCARGRQGESTSMPSSRAAAN
jgi:arginyl-tRNA synthetase